MVNDKNLPKSINISSPLISVIVPIYMVEKYLHKCVDSIINQIYKSLEIILVDDGSLDNCPGICDQYAKYDERIKVIHKKNGGLASARNAALEICKGEYVAFVDSDDWIELSIYNEMMQMILSFDLDIVCCAANEIENDYIKQICFQYYTTGEIHNARDITKKILLDSIGSQVVKGLYKRNCWDMIRFPEGMIYEDIPVTFKVFSKARQVGFISKPLYNYRLNPKGISNSPQPIKPYHIYLGFKEHYDYAKKHFPEIVDECRANAAQYAISTYFHYCSDSRKELKPYINDIVSFLEENKERLLCFNGFLITRKLALLLFYYSRSIFKISCRIFNRVGLQKLLKFDVK